MTTSTPYPGNGGSLTPPHLAEIPGMVGGGHSTIFHDVIRAGLDPGAAFGGAFSLQRVVGADRVNEALQRYAGNGPSAGGGVPDTVHSATPTPSAPAASPTAPASGGAPTGAPQAGAPQTAPQTSLDGSVGSPMDNPTVSMQNPPASPNPAGEAHANAPAARPDPAARVALADPPPSAAGKAAVKDAEHTMSRIFAEKGAAAAVREGGVLAAKRGAALGGKALAMTLLRAGTVTLPVLGSGISVAMWLIDTDGRKAFNNLIASTIGGGSAAPELNAPPAPPRTHFLPLTNDGNRDVTIEQMDHGMCRTNTAAFGLNPDDVWPTDSPTVSTLSDFGSVADKVNALNAQLTQVVEAVTNVYQSAASEPYVAQAWTNTKSGVEALADFQSTVLPAIGAQLMAGATAANNAYQAFRGINLKNRQEISNSTSGLIPFWTNHVNAGNMSDSTAELKTATDDMERIAQKLAAAADPFVIKPNLATAPTSQRQHSGDDVSHVTPQTPPASQTPAASSLPGTTAPAGGKPADPAKDLASLLRNAAPGMGSGMPGLGGMPQVPGLGGMPQVPGAGAGAKPMNFDPKPIDKDELKKALDDKKKPVDDAKKAPGESGLGTPVGTPGTGGKTPPATERAAATPENPAAATNTTEVGGRKWTFDNPKAAALVHNLSGTDGIGHKSIQQAASEAGYKLPPPGQDIGTPVAGINDLKPGDVIMGANNRNGVFLGVVDGQAMAINEQGEVKPLDQVAVFDGPHQGMFHLADDGAPATGQVQQTAAQIPPAAPQGPPTTEATNPGLAPGQHTGQPGLDPGSVPPGN